MKTEYICEAHGLYQGVDCSKCTKLITTREALVAVKKAYSKSKSDGVYNNGVTQALINLSEL